MQTISKSYDIYTYGELSSGAKEQVKAWYLEGQDTDTFSDEVMDILESSYGLMNLKPQYSLGYCQGDGFCLVGQINVQNEILDNKNFRAIALKDFSEQDIKVLKSMADDGCSSIDFEHNNYMYYHKHSVKIFYDTYWSQMEEEFTDYIEEKIVKNIIDWYMEECDKFEESGYSYFYEIDDDELEDICDSNGYTFLEDGTIF